MSRKGAAAVAAIVLAAVPFGADAADIVDIADDSPWKIGIAFGYGQRTNPLVRADDIDILVDIDIAWFGKRWFFDNGDVGRTLLDRERFTVNAVARLNSDRVFFSKTDSDYVSLFSEGFGASMVTLQPIEVPDRDYALEAGIELLSDGDWGFLQAAIHADASNTHGGYELYASYGRTFRRQRWFFEPSIGFAWKSPDMNDYYWGVRPEESSIGLPEYRAGAGVNGELRLAASYQLTRHWTFLIAAQYERLSREAAKSPLVEERSVRGGFAGFNYRF